MAETDDEKVPAAAPAPVETAKALAPQTKAGDMPKFRSKAFRAKLLSRLPMMAPEKWDADDALNVYQDFRGVVSLDADAFLRPIEPLAEDRNER